MRLLPTFLWKEWRDHRGPLLAASVVLPLLMVLFELVMPASVTLNRDLPGIFAVMTLGVVVLAFFGDAFAGEERRGTIALQRRQPGGWWPPFAAKLLFLAAIALVFTSGAFGVGALLLNVLHGVAPQVDLRHGTTLLAELLLLVPAWTVVVSIWFPRSSVALPGSITILVLFAAPIALALAFNDGLWPSDREWTVGLGWLVAASPVVAALSFARGRFVERERWRAGVVGLLATLGVFAPAYGWTAKRVADFRSIDPTAASFRLDEWNFLATNGRYAYVTAYHSFGDPSRWNFHRDPSLGDGPNHALRIDLADGSWQDLAGPGSRVWSVPEPIPLHPPLPYVVIDSGAARRRTPRASQSAGATDSREMPIYDADSGALARADFDDAFTSARDDIGSRFQRLTNYLVLPDRSRAWFDHGHLVRTTADGGTRVLPDSELPPSTRFAGSVAFYVHGASLGGGEMYDAMRERRFKVPEGMFVRWVHDGECYVYDVAEKRVGASCARWNWSTHEYSPMLGVTKDQALFEMMDDGRLLVGERVKVELETPKGSSEWKVGRLWLLDTTTGAREPVEPPAGFGEYTSQASTVGRTPDGAPVMAIFDWKQNRQRHARFDLAARRFDLLAPEVTTPLFLVGCAAEDSAIVCDGHRLLRAWFGRPGLEVLFPKPTK